MLSPSALVNTTYSVRNAGRGHVAETKYPSQGNRTDEAREFAWASPKNAWMEPFSYVLKLHMWPVAQHVL
jgi:hypothetical protein